MRSSSLGSILQRGPIVLGWASTCVLACGLHGKLVHGADFGWAEVGLAGLAMALILEIGVWVWRRKHSELKVRAFDEHVDRRLQGALGRDESAASTFLLDTLCPPDAEAKSAPVRRSEQRYTCDAPAEILAERIVSGGHESQIVRFAGRLRDLSTNGFAISHTERITKRQVILCVGLPSGEYLDVLAELRWTDSDGNSGWLSGGKMQKILSQSTERTHWSADQVRAVFEQYQHESDEETSDESVAEPWVATAASH